MRNANVYRITLNGSEAKRGVEKKVSLRGRSPKQSHGTFLDALRDRHVVHSPFTKVRDSSRWHSLFTSLTRAQRSAAKCRFPYCHCERTKWAKQSRANRVSSLKRRRIFFEYASRSEALKRRRIFFEFGRSPQQYSGIATPFGLSKKISFSFRRARFARSFAMTTTLFVFARPQPKQSRANRVSSLKRRRIFFEFGRSPQPCNGIATPFGLSKKISFSFRRARFARSFAMTTNYGNINELRICSMN